MLTIGQVAQCTGFSASTLRYYEDLGLVVPTARTTAGYRMYDGAALTRLGFIARAKRLGCSLQEIADLLDVWDGRQCAPVQRRLLDLVSEKIRATQHQIGELGAFAAQLRNAAARMTVPPVDGACGPGCACLAPEMAPAPADAPIACTLAPDELPTRRARWEAMLANGRTHASAPGGRLRIEFDEGIDVGELARLLDDEQRCCAFLTFALTIHARGVTLEVDAPHEAAAIVGALFGQLGQKPRARSSHALRPGEVVEPARDVVRAECDALDQVVRAIR